MRLYFDKDIVENAFHARKSVIKLHPVRHRLTQRVIAHVFIGYPSYLLLSLLKFRLKALEISPEAALKNSIRCPKFTFVTQTLASDGFMRLGAGPPPANPGILPNKFAGPRIS